MLTARSALASATVNGKIDAMGGCDESNFLNTVEEYTPPDESESTTTDRFTVANCQVVALDIQPGSYPNSINYGSGGTVPVAILSSESFDAPMIDPTTVTLAGATVKLKGKGTPMASEEDVDGDGFLDVVIHVETEALELCETDTEAVLAGETYDSRCIRGVDTVRIVPPSAPLLLHFSLGQNRPNPFNPDTWIPDTLAHHVKVVIPIHHSLGQLVQTLDIGHQPAGHYINKDHAAYWDGRNNSGQSVASGVYYYTLQAGQFQATRKMLRGMHRSNSGKILLDNHPQLWYHKQH